MQARAKLAPCLRIPDQELSVWIEGAAAKVTKAYFIAIDMAEGFGIDTTDVDNFDKGAVIEKVVQGPPEFEGKWDLCSVMKAFAPNMYTRPHSVKRALARTSVTEYHSRRELQMKHVNNVTMTFIYMHTADIYKLFLKFDVAGVRKHAARLWKNVQTDDSGAMGKLVQAGEAAQQPIADQEMSVVIGATADKAVDTLVPVRQLSMQDHENYTVAEGAPVQEILQGMLGPRCDDNRDAFHQLALKLRDLENNDSAKKEMKVEIWTFKGDGTKWVNATSIFKYIYTGARDQFARMQKSHFQNTNIPHKLLEVPGVHTIFFI